LEYLQYGNNVNVRIIIIVVIDSIKLFDNRFFLSYNNYSLFAFILHFINFATVNN